LSIQRFNSVQENGMNVRNVTKKDLKSRIPFLGKNFHASMPKLNSDEVSFSGINVQ